MLKDNENMPFIDDGPLVTSEHQRFAPDEMVRCEVCLRTNPPNRTNCLYCAAALSVNRKIIEDLPLVLKPIDDSIAGYNCILVPKDADELSATQLPNAAKLLNLEASELKKILDAHSPLPLVRTSTRADADLLTTKLLAFGLSTKVISDVELGSLESDVLNVRAAEITEERITLKQLGGDKGKEVPWSDIVLIVSGRLITRRVESAEQKGRRGKNEIIEATQFFADELVMDIYANNRNETFRIAANRFDFSSLLNRGLMAAENFISLLHLIRARSPAAQQDDSYMSLRQSLDPVWRSGQRTESGGWRRDRPGKYAVEAVTESSNVIQFTRYSRLRFLLLNRSNLQSPV